MDINLHSDADRTACPYCNLCDRPHFELSPSAQMGSQSRLRLILIGHPEDVSQEVLNLYHCGYEIDRWSPPQLVPDTGEVVRIYTKRSRRGSTCR